MVPFPRKQTFSPHGLSLERLSSQSGPSRAKRPSIFNILSALDIKLHHRVEDLISYTGIETQLYGHVLVNVSEVALKKKSLY